jgi:ribosome-associated heat shock protein Hsp15
VVRTRSAAAELATCGHVRINGQKVNAPSRAVRAGDVVTIALDRAVRVIRVLGFAERRGSADEARELCEPVVPDPSPGGPASPPTLHRTSAGRPTKRERRAIDRLLRGDERP